MTTEADISAIGIILPILDAGRDYGNPGLQINLFIV